MDSIGGWNVWNGTSFLLFPFLPFCPSGCCELRPHVLVDGGGGWLSLMKKTVIFSPIIALLLAILLAHCLHEKTFDVHNFYWCSR
jgi:hypothetical protein